MGREIKQQEQQHPLEKPDREMVNRLLSGDPTPYHLAELARLRIRYRNFPGAREIQRDLDLLLDKWHLTEAELYEKTRQIHTNSPVYQGRSKEDRQDWS